MVVSFFLSMYYNVINAWAFWYLFHSFQVSWLCQSRVGAGKGEESRAPTWERWEVGGGRLRGSQEIMQRAGGDQAPKPSRGLLNLGSMDPAIVSQFVHVSVCVCLEHISGEKGHRSHQVL